MSDMKRLLSAAYMRGYIDARNDKAIDPIGAIERLTMNLNNDDTVSRQEAIEELEWFCATKALKDQNHPSAEPEVTRCKDCKYHVGEGCCDYWGEGRMFLDISDSDYCSKAERRKE